MMIVGQVSKTQFVTKARAYGAEKYQAVWMFLWKTFPLHPILTGAAIGSVWENPEPGVHGIASMFYFMLAGALSVVLYQVIKGLAKKGGIRFSITNEDQK